VGHDPGFGRAYCALALDLRECGETAMGLSAVSKALRLMPNYAGAWNLQGDLQQDTGQTEEALRSWGEALRLNPSYLGARCNLANLLAVKRRREESRSAYNAALQVDSTYVAALLGRAELSLDERAFTWARQDYEACLRLPNAAPEAWLGLHQVDMAQGFRQQAAEDMRRYRQSLRERDGMAARLAQRGMEQPAPYEPGVPPIRANLSTSAGAHP
jgi:tetratricopeptide (TPR) repeat protein